MFNVCFLGQFRIREAERDVKFSRSIRARSLIAFLVLHRGQRFPREVLADLMWGDLRLDARKTLRQSLHDIGRCGHALLEVKHDEVGMSGDAPVHCDVDAFVECTRVLDRMRTEGDDRALDDPEVEALRAGIEVYRGDLLPGFYDDWCLSHRERLRLRYLFALEALFHHHREREDWAQAVGLGARLLQADPLLEHVHREMMICHYQRGNRAGAIAQFETCKRVLMRELNVHPMRETVEVYEAIRRDAARSTPRAPLPSGVLHQLEAISQNLKSASRAIDEMKRRTSSS